MLKHGIGIVLGLALMACGAAGPKPDATAGASEEPKSVLSEWKAKYTKQAATDAQNLEEKASPTGYGGSIPYEKSQVYPAILTNYKGSAFSKEYKEDRGHGNTIRDLVSSKRVNEKTPAACITCKTADTAALYESMGWSYASKKLSEIPPSQHPAIDCFTCHDPQTNKLRIWQPGFKEALKRTGVVLEKVTQKQLEAYLCAQCHSEYYFEPGTNKVVHPWDQGLSPEAIYAYYQTKPAGFDGDFTQPDSQVRLLKAQHPDYEEYSQGIHAAAGVSCVDCHMPQLKGDDGKKFHSHHITSPLHTIKESCLTCHTGKTESWMLDQVKEIQDSVAQAQKRSGDTLALAHQTLEKALKAGKAPSTLSQAQSLVREAQWHWDYPASANSMGFHNPVGTLASFNHAIDLAWQAIALLGS